MVGFVAGKPWVLLVDDADEPDAEVVSCTAEVGRMRQGQNSCAESGSTLYTRTYKQTSIDISEEAIVPASSYVLVYVCRDCRSRGLLLL